MDQRVTSLLREKCFVDGAWVGEPALAVTNPATGDEIATVPSLGADETRDAIAAAETAFKTWRMTTAKERSTTLRRWFDLQVEHADELAAIMTAEQGKPLAEARCEVIYAASFTEFFAEEAKRINGETIPAHNADARIVVVRQPVGVVAAITPWNFPMAMITRKVAPALAAGCTVVCKPASETPLTALALAELADQAGVPKGVFNVITGKASVIGGELTSNPTVKMVTFTGSTDVGKILLRQCAD
ncbi:MAG: aldehyde dehydrogenase family protein, partial [Hyphomicrobiaceae bacterium]